MPRMSKRQKQEWALFLNERNRITYNELAENRNDCKQSLRKRGTGLYERARTFHRGV